MCKDSFANNNYVLVLPKEDINDSTINSFHSTYSHDGRLILVSEPRSTEYLIKNGLKGNDAYKDADFIILSKSDAQNIVDMLNEAILKLEDENHKDDIGVFGDKAISYERLIDRLDGLLYKVDKQERESTRK